MNKPTTYLAISKTTPQLPLQKIFIFLPCDSIKFSVTVKFLEQYIHFISKHRKK